MNVVNATKTCSYCGQTNPAEAADCRECGGSALVDPDVARSAPASALNVAAASLLIIAILYGLIAITNLLIARSDSEEILREGASRWYWAGLRNWIIAALCFAARQMIRTRKQVLSTGAAFLLSIALFMTVSTWIAARMNGRNALPWIEVLIVWPVLLYSAAIAYKESRKHPLDP